MRALSYQAYQPLAHHSLTDIIRRAREKWTLKRVAVVHRLGQVGIGELSVAIVVSSEHRHDSLEAVTFIIETLKQETAIWKREEYVDGTSTWKENCCRRHPGQGSSVAERSSQPGH